MKKTALLLTIAALVGGLSSAGLAAGSSGSFTGTWKLSVACKGYSQINTLRIWTANQSDVRGTTNVGDGYGQIVGGSFDGANVTFFNQYTWNGKHESEVWKGHLSRDGQYLVGSFKSTSQSTLCAFEGPRR